VHLTAKLAVCALAAVLLAIGCSRQPYVSESSDQKAGEAEDEPKLPFERPPDSGGISPSSSLVPAVHNVPAGTPMTIRLKSSLSTDTVHSGDSFQAVLDEPISVQGRTIAASGTPVTGAVVALNRSATLQEPAYLELKLTSIAVGGKNIAIESSSIFSKAGLEPRRAATGEENPSSPSIASSPRSSVTQKKIQFGAERRLTFRLTAPVSLSR
jgi:hypothetical protein